LQEVHFGVMEQKILKLLCRCNTDSWHSWEPTGAGSTGKQEIQERAICSHDSGRERRSIELSSVTFATKVPHTFSTGLIGLCFSSRWLQLTGSLAVWQVRYNTARELKAS